MISNPGAIKPKSRARAVPLLSKQKREAFIARPLALRYLGLGLLVLTFWPIWQWYAFRMTESPEGFTAVIALMTAAILGTGLVLQTATSVFRKQEKHGEYFSAPTEQQLLVFLIITLAVYAVGFSIFPAAVRAALAISTISVYLSASFLGRWSHPGFCALLLLSLPVVPALEFHAGYLMRLITAEGAVWIWAPVGLNIQRAGASLQVENAIVWVDAACAGVKMLWAGGFIMALMAITMNLSWPRLIIYAAITLLLVLGSNALRAAWLVPIEVNGTGDTDPMHTITGCMAFGAGALAITFTGWLISREGTQCVRRLFASA